MNEMKAGQSLSKKLPHCVLKMIKLKEVPTPKDLIKQLIIIQEQWIQLSNSPKCVNVKLEKRDSEEAQETTNKHNSSIF